MKAQIQSNRVFNGRSILGVHVHETEGLQQRGSRRHPYIIVATLQTRYGVASIFHHVRFADKRRAEQFAAKVHQSGRIDTQYWRWARHGNSAKVLGFVNDAVSDLPVLCSHERYPAPLTAKAA